MNDDKPESASEIAEGLPPMPSVDGDRTDWGEHDVGAKEPTAIEVFYAWEKIRIVYNVLVTLFIFGYRMAIQRQFHHSETTGLPWLYLAANIFFCIGPVIENYLSCVGLPPHGVLMQILDRARPPGVFAPRTGWTVPAIFLAGAIRFDSSVENVEHPCRAMVTASLIIWF